jgi:hypothetical protein
MHWLTGFPILESRLSDMLTAGPLNDTSHFSDMLTAGPTMALSSLSGFRLHDSEMPKPLVTRIPDIPMTKMPIDDFLSGLSPMAPIAATHPPLMDGPDYSSRFRDF